MQTFFSNTFPSRLLQTLLAILALGGLAYIAIQSLTILLLLIFSVVLAVGLSSLSQLLKTYTRIPYTAALFGVLVTFLGALGIFFSYLIPAVVQEFSQADVLIEQVNTTLEDISTQIAGNSSLSASFNPEQVVQTLQDRGSSIVSGVQSIFTSTFSVLLNVLIMLVIAVYLALNPRQYVQGFVHLFPKKDQLKVHSMMDTANHSLQWWLLARLSSMLIIGLLTYVGLLILNIPLAFSLAVLAGLLSFIPNLGPVLSFVPALLVAITVSWPTVASVAILYIIVQVIESNVITPTIEKRMVSTPPALLLANQVILGTVFGFMGLLLAAPLMAVSIGLWDAHKKDTSDN